MLQKKGARLFLTLFLVFSYFLASTKPTEAAFLDAIKSFFNVQPATQSYGQAIISKNVNQENNVTGANSSTLTYILTSVAGGGAVARLGNLSEQETSMLRESVGDGLISDVNRGIVALYEPPATTQTYVADLMKSAKIIPEAQAQGLGFSALDPILETWKAFRNLAYLFFVVIFLVIGFMIMFRTKVDQTAITAQQAIPSVIVAMLAVTFSYAIAGLMIDLMYVAMYMVAGFFSEGPEVINNNLLGLVGLMFQGTDGVQETIEQFMEDALNIGWLGEALAWLSSLFGAVIVGLAVLVAAFKVFFELIKTYVAVLIQIIFSPIILMFGAIPGKNTFGKWIKDLTGNLILWPVVLLCILVQRMLTAPIRSLQGTGDTLDAAFGGGFMPPFLVGQGQASIIPVIVGLGVLLVIPEIMQQVKKAMGVSEGVFGELAKAAGQNMKIAEPLAPYMAGGIGAAGSSLLAGGQMLADPNSRIRKQGLFVDGKLNRNAIRGLGVQMRDGWIARDEAGQIIRDSNGQPVRKGGLKGGYQTGKSVGDWARVQADRARSGQLLEAETVEKSVARLIGQKDGDKDKDKDKKVRKLPT